jgi:hypothetical protein
MQDPVRKSVRKKVEEFDAYIREIYVDNLETYYIPIIQGIILQEYDSELTGRVTDRRSRTNPIYYRDEFEEALINFEWIERGRDYTKLTVPDISTFNWNQGRLRIIENILEGTIGTFIEVDEEQYVAMYGKRPVIRPFDSTVSIKQRIYLLRLSSNVLKKWRSAYPKKREVRFPFSNQPPTDIFDTANRYVEGEIDGWIDEAIKEAQKEIVK